jgi:hypothetical protein
MNRSGYSYEEMKDNLFTSSSTSALQRYYFEGVTFFNTVLNTFKYEEGTEMEWNDKRIIGAIDCVAFFRDRIHPGSGTLFRVDKV